MNPAFHNQADSWSQGILNRMGARKFWGKSGAKVTALQTLAR
jgi:hypothetical protein